MPICKKCNGSFPNRILINGKHKVLNRRKYCLICSPFGRHNTIQLEMSRDKRKRQDDWHKRQIKTRRERKRQFVEMKGGCCYICGYNKCLKCLSFHHVDSDSKLFGLNSTRFSNTRLEVLLEELKKTVCLCNNCHGEVHAGIHREIEKKWKKMVTVV